MECLFLFSVHVGGPSFSLGQLLEARVRNSLPKFHYANFCQILQKFRTQTMKRESYREFSGFSNHVEMVVTVHDKPVWITFMEFSS